MKKTRRRSSLQDRSKAVSPFVVLSGNYGLARIIRRRFSRPLGWMGSTAGLRQIETEWAGRAPREGKGGRDESRKAAETTTRKWKSFMRGRDRASGRQIKRSDGAWDERRRRRRRRRRKRRFRKKGEGDAEARLYTSIREIETVFFIIPESELQKRTRDGDQHTSLWPLHSLAFPAGIFRAAISHIRPKY